MAITPQQLNTAQTVLTNIELSLRQLRVFANQVQILMTNNWQVTTTVAGVSAKTTISTADQTALVAQYTTLKANLVTLFNQLP